VLVTALDLVVSAVVLAVATIASASTQCTAMHKSTVLSPISHNTEQAAQHYSLNYKQFIQQK
jgi:hypothetical protein